MILSRDPVEMLEESQRATTALLEEVDCAVPASKKGDIDLIQ